MGLVAAIREMLAKGLPIEQALMAAEILEANMPPPEPIDTRSVAAKRQARYRDRKRNGDVTERNKPSRGVTRVTTPPKKERSPHTPLKEKTPSLFPSVTPNGVTSPSQDLVDWFEAQWNGLAASCGLPKIQAMTDTRISHIRRRAEDLVKALRFPDPQSGFTETFNRIRGSPWLRGANGWKADVDWILTERNFLQIHEGKYARDQRPEHNRR